MIVINSLNVYNIATYINMCQHPPKGEEQIPLRSGFNWRGMIDGHPKFFYRYGRTTFTKLGEMLNVDWNNIFIEHGCEDNVEKQWTIFQDIYE